MWLPTWLYEMKPLGYLGAGTAALTHGLPLYGMIGGIIFIGVGISYFLMRYRYRFGEIKSKIIRYD